MIVVRVELWPHGQKWKAREIARMELAHVGGSELFGDYTVRSDDLERCEERRGTVSAHARRGDPVLRLVAKALKAVGYTP
jgi:hypothetical protein